MDKLGIHKTPEIVDHQSPKGENIWEQQFPNADKPQVSALFFFTGFME